MSKTKRPPAEEIILYEKDPKTKIATITFNRPELLNAPTSGPGCATPTCSTGPTSTTTSRSGRPRRRRRLRSGCRPARVHGALMDEPAEAPSRVSCRLDGEDVSYPPEGRSGTGATLSQWYANPRGGHAAPCRTSRRSASSRPRGTATAGTSTRRRRRSGDLVGRRALRPPGLPLVRLGPADVDLGHDHGHPEVPGDGLHRPAVHGRGDGRLQLRQQRGPPGRTRGRGRPSTPAPAARNRPTDAVVMQKAFFQMMKQHQGEYMGSIMSAVPRVDGRRCRPPTART